MVLNKKVGLVILAVSVLFLASSASFADDSTKVGVDLTSVGMGARPIALGGAYSAVADDASAVFTNPAGLGLQSRLSFISMSTKILNTVDYTLAGFSYPTEFGTFGVGYVGAVTPAGDYVYYDDPANQVGTEEGGSMNYSDQMIILSYGSDISGLANDTFGLEGFFRNLSAGINVKMISEGLTGGPKNSSASGYETDLGLMYSPTDRLSFGATAQNVMGSVSWATSEQEKLPSILKIGTAYKALDNVIVSMDNDIDLDGNKSLASHLGTEWQVIPMLALRAGLDQKNASIDDGTVGLSTSYTLGVGINYAGFRFDYAYRQDPVFAEYSSQYFSFCYTGFEQPKQVKTADKVADKGIIEKYQPEELQKIKDGRVEKMVAQKPSTNNSDDTLTAYEKLLQKANND